MPDYEFFDVSVILGKPRLRAYHDCSDASRMRDDLAGFGITGGLVQHTMQEDVGPGDGNEVLVEALHGTTGFEPLLAVMPHWTGEFAEPPFVLDKMREVGSRAVVTYPATQGFSLAETVWGGLLDVLESVAAPFFLPVEGLDLEEVRVLAEAHSSLPIVLGSVTYRTGRMLYPLLERCGNVFIETSMYMVNGGIEGICRRFGAERLLFGSRYAFYNPGAAVAGVMYADISVEQRRLIAGDNARKLLKGVLL